MSLCSGGDGRTLDPIRLALTYEYGIDPSTIQEDFVAGSWPSMGDIALSDFALNPDDGLGVTQPTN